MGRLPEKLKKSSVKHKVTCHICQQKFGLVFHYGGDKKIKEKDCKLCQEISVICMECK